MRKTEMLVQTAYGAIFGLLLGACLTAWSAGWCVPSISPWRAAVGGVLLVVFGVITVMRGIMAQTPLAA